MKMRAGGAVGRPVIILILSLTLTLSYVIIIPKINRFDRYTFLTLLHVIHQVKKAYLIERLLKCSNA